MAQNDKRNAGAAVQEQPAPVQPAPQPEAIQPAAPAPAPPAAQAAPAAPVNRYSELFESIHFETIDNAKTYPNERDGSMSKALANAMVVFRGGFAAVPAKVQAIKPKSGSPYVEVKFFATMLQSAIKPLDEQSKAEFAEYRRTLAVEYQRWRNAQPTVTTKRVETGVQMEGLDGIF